VSCDKHLGLIHNGVNLKKGLWNWTKSVNI